MNIKSVEFYGEDKVRKAAFIENVNLIYSNKNSVGKSSFTRLIFYSLGYNIPGTRLLEFPKIKTKIVFERDGKIFTIKRLSNVLEIIDDTLKTTYDLSYQGEEVLRKIWGDYDVRILKNLLGCMYLDQEKGWTLLNRGKVIGSISFNLEELVRGLSNTDSQDLEVELELLNKELRKYKHMVSFKEYQDEVLTDSQKINGSDYEKTMLAEIENERISKANLEIEIRNITKLIEENSIFIKFIEDFRISVKSSDGEIVPVNKTTIVNYPENLSFLKTKIKFAQFKIMDIKKTIFELEKKYDDHMRYLGLKNEAEIFDYNIQKISVNQLQIKKIISSLEEKKKDKSRKLRKLTVSNNNIIELLHEEIIKYVEKLKLKKYFTKSSIENKEQLVFSSDLKSLSGTVLHSIVFCYKMAYMNIVKTTSGINLPIVLDSPSGKEIKRPRIMEMMSILKDDFSDHQIIISSIFSDYFEEMNVIKIKNKLFEEKLSLSQISIDDYIN